METFIQSFFLSSLIMSVLILLIWLIHSFAANIFTAKLRYATWIVILLGFLIPFRFSVGQGAIVLPPLNQPESAYQGATVDEMQNFDTQDNVANEQSPAVETYEAAPATYEQAVNPVVPEVSNTPANMTVDQTSTSSVANFFSTITLVRVILIIWAVGAVGILSYHLVQYMKFQRQIGRWGEQEDDVVTWDVFHDVQDEMGLAHKNIGLLTCPFITSSMLTGLFKPVILLPERNFDQDELALIFKHELVHYKRHDLLIKFLSLVAIAIHWYNPVIYLLSRQMQAEGEASCDEYVLRGADEKNRHFYAEVIIGMIGSKNRMTFLATNFYGGKFDIKKRLTSVMDTRKKFPLLSYGLFAVALFVTIFSGSVFATSIYQHLPSEMNNLSSERAEAIAIAYVGGGTVVRNESSDEDDVSSSLFLVRVSYRDINYQVEIDRKTGEITDLFTISDLDEQSQVSDDTIITMEDAIDIAQDYLESNDLTGATLTSAYLSMENDVEVWNIEFDLGGTNYEFHINVLTGELLLTPELSDED